MFRRKRDDTTIASVEATYGVNLNARGDALLGNLLERRGFDSQSQLLDAYHGRLRHHASRRNIFLSFHMEDKAQVQGFRLMMKNPNLGLDVYGGGLSDAINSERGAYVRSQIKPMINRASVLVCLIGDGTAWREWVDWEIETAIQLGKGVCGVRLKGSRGRSPEILQEIRAPVAGWGDVDDIISVVECAAARRS